MKLFNTNKNVGLLEQFIEFAKKEGYKESGFKITKNNTQKIISFGELIDRETVYDIAICFHNEDNTVEVYVMKSIQEAEDDLFSTLKKTNELTADYIGVSFHIEDGKAIFLKSYCKTSNLEVVLKQMAQTVAIAKKEFIKFK
ncbi:MAG: hypothetical protein K0R54_1816 [Clostridiaceae bacterium]|jgi:hypothetical protein|nr:hypothetical protein [Clostridiaceae bacterium]